MVFGRRKLEASEDRSRELFRAKSDVEGGEQV